MLKLAGVTYLGGRLKSRSYGTLSLGGTVIDVITAPEKINSTSEWRIFRTQKIAFSPSWRLNYGGAYIVYSTTASIEFVEKMGVV